MPNIFSRPKYTPTAATIEMTATACIRVRETMVKYIKWLLPVLFIAYYSSVSLFTHVHVEHGTTIVHAHPFKKTADGTCHHHTSLAEIQLFHMLYSRDGRGDSPVTFTILFFKNI